MTNGKKVLAVFIPCTTTGQAIWPISGWQSEYTTVAAIFVSIFAHVRKTSTLKKTDKRRSILYNFYHDPLRRQHLS